MIKAIVFDLDDTLYDASSCYAEGMRQLAAYAQDRFHISGEEFDAKFAQARGIVKSRLGNVAASHNRLLYIQAFLELAGGLPAVHAADMYDVYWNTVLEKMRLFPYVIPLFQMLHEKEITIAVLSDLTAHIQHRKIRALGIGPYIDVLVTSEEAGEEKPSGKMFELAMKKNGAGAAELLMVGDSRERDIRGAMEMGIRAVWYQDGMDMIEEVEKYL